MKGRCSLRLHATLATRPRVWVLFRVGPQLVLSFESVSPPQAPSLLCLSPPPAVLPSPQVLLEGRAKLEEVVRSRGRAAARAGDHADVLRFTRLTRPLRLQQEGVELLTGFLRRLVADRAREDYDALVDSFAVAGEGGRSADYLGTLTNLFKDVAAAVDEHLELIRDTFGPGGRGGAARAGTRRVPGRDKLGPPAAPRWWGAHARRCCSTSTFSCLCRAAPGLRVRSALCSLSALRPPAHPRCRAWPDGAAEHTHRVRCARHQAAAAVSAAIVLPASAVVQSLHAGDIR